MILDAIIRWLQRARLLHEWGDWLECGPHVHLIRFCKACGRFEAL